MSALLHGIGLALVIVGLVFMILGSIGIVRLPDFFARTHAASKVDTVGVTIVTLGVACMVGFSLDGLKVLLTALFVMLTNPVSAHALARAAIRSGLRPWSRNGSDAEPRRED
jgi:multicomponent Na+:H+ antiporter subunit G